MKYAMKNILTLCVVGILFVSTQGNPVRRCSQLTHHDAPPGGGLVCLTFLQHQFCAVRCNEGFNLAKPARHFDFCGPDTGYRWTHQYTDSSARINYCVPNIYGGFHLEENAFFLPGVCGRLSPEHVNTILEEFAQMVVPEELQGSRYRAELICHQTTSASQCKELTSADAPQNGALVCYNKQNNKYCALRCNYGFEFPGPVNDFEFCRLQTNFTWTFDTESEHTCIEELFPGVRFTVDLNYLPQTCDQLTAQQQNKVKDDFKQILEAGDVSYVTRNEISIHCGRNT